MQIFSPSKHTQSLQSNLKCSKWAENIHNHCNLTWCSEWAENIHNYCNLTWCSEWAENIHNYCNLSWCSEWAENIRGMSIQYTPILLYRDDSCIGDFTYHVNIHSQRHLAIVYLRNISKQILNSHLQQKLCKMSNIVKIKFIYIGLACRKQYSAHYGYPCPIKYPSSTSKMLRFHYFRVRVCCPDVRGHAAIFGHVTSIYGKFSQYAKVWDEISVSNNN